VWEGEKKGSFGGEKETFPGRLRTRRLRVVTLMGGKFCVKEKKKKKKRSQKEKQVWILKEMREKGPQFGKKKKCKEELNGKREADTTDLGVWFTPTKKGKG